jgi:hypothetical protein
MSWVNDFADNARDDDDNRLRREKAYEQQMWGVWNSLVSKVRLDIEVINRDNDLIKRRLGGEKLRFEQPQGDSSFTVSKITIPSMYLTVSNRHRYFEVEVKSRITPDAELSHKPLERIAVEPDEAFNLYMHLPKTNAGSLSFDDISQHLLEPLMSPIK